MNRKPNNLFVSHSARPWYYFRKERAEPNLKGGGTGWTCRAQGHMVPGQGAGDPQQWLRASAGHPWERQGEEGRRNV